ncbi:MAG: hypothetical protein J0G33_02385 [Afipia felis]|jgi:hypothetical protein|uniref:Uncharacterized protein n=2 Tax=Afipia felis TaxID=1035 RepID=A0A380W606_AFIFE|nr:hypothetical protein [Afipia felis]EKS27594.1 hypothetical protein HMPREF9697_00122 [Afipia felis ATCC 53690]MBN9601758.1 hypothetical protein [Afipia felis]SUU76303.1 Uncharacterised protein [Afipia felis]SUU84370.1 Uncharacterised protein [Afipia felis]
MNDHISIAPLNWKTLVAQARAEADAAPEGRDRDKILERAELIEMSAHIEGWLNATDLRPPVGR